MKIVCFLNRGQPLTELSERQKERFIEQIERAENDSVLEGIRRALVLMGYDIEEGEQS